MSQILLPLGILNIQLECDAVPGKLPGFGEASKRPKFGNHALAPIGTIILRISPGHVVTGTKLPWALKGKTSLHSLQPHEWDASIHYGATAQRQQ